MKALRLLVLFAITSIHTPDAGSAAPTSPQRTPATEPRCPGAPQKPKSFASLQPKVTPKELRFPTVPSATHTPGQ